MKNQNNYFFMFIKFKNYAPTAISLLGVYFGFLAIKYSIYGRIDIVAKYVILCVICDYIDGFVARKLKAESIFGMNIDSLCDSFCFGFVPSACLYFWIFADLKSVGGIICFIISVAMIIRLARYNTIQSTKSEKEKKDFFIGIPAPMFSLLAFLPVMLLTDMETSYCSKELDPQCPFIVETITSSKILKNILVSYYIFISYLAISKIPITSLKSIKIKINRFVKYSLLIIVFAFTMIYSVRAIIIFNFIIAMYIIYSICRKEKNEHNN